MVLYGRGVPSIAEQLHTTTEIAQEIKESVFRGFPAIKKFEQDSLDMARELGYVTTVCGRKRRLPDLQLNDYDYKWADGYQPVGDLLDFDDTDVEVPLSKMLYYDRKLAKAYGKGSKIKIFEEANKEHIYVIDNTGKIADSTRQCVNARIQGSRADLTKIAMIALNNSAEARALGLRILIPVHDELICECPEIYAKEGAELLAHTMSQRAEQILQMPIKCDVEITRQWYGDVVNI